LASHQRVISVFALKVKRILMPAPDISGSARFGADIAAAAIQCKLSDRLAPPDAVACRAISKRGRSFQ
jgi:hypothetical protein